MSTRVLMILNAIGCLLLTAVVVGQWAREHALKMQIKGLQYDIGSLQIRVDEEIQKREGVERDVVMLKDSLDQARKAIEVKDAQFAEREVVVGKLKQEIELTQKQLEVWNKAVEDRDRRIQLLNANLLEASKRLDEAIGQLKAQRNR